MEKKTGEPKIQTYKDVLHILQGEENTTFGRGYTCNPEVLPIHFLAKGSDNKFYVPPYDIQKYNQMIRFSPDNTTGKNVKEWGVEYSIFIEDVKRALQVKSGGRTRRRK